MTSDYNKDLNRKTNFESFEPRLVMSAQALNDFVADFETTGSQVDVDQFIETLSTDGGQTAAATDLESIREQYDLSGKGQTIAVIDSGIFYNHDAFGGFGEGHRVVGGYDFAENDADPHEDGPVGIHGTHVAGIIGASSDEFSGIAPGADLVSLRVFDDNGAGDLDWVEQALQWVHDNREAYEHPITTVNLSIGMNWNSDSVPALAQLEDEFAQLEQDGIFISVSAGNFFQSYNTTGVSYPAASPFVVPVASHGADGNLSDFSQRSSDVLVAPGESILSTVPDHIYRDGTTDGYLRSTGTSQAAPYVAGASALLREAFQRAGTENIDQDFLYDHFRETADVIHDQATGGYYHRINVERAIAEALVDDHGDAYSTSTNVGNVGGGEQIRGNIGTVADVDHFRFVADRSGQFIATVNSGQTFVPEFTSGFNATQNENQISFDVVAGNEYAFAIGSAEGIGDYTIDLDIVAAPPAAAYLDSSGNLFVNGSSGNDSITFRHGSMIEVNVNGQQFQFQNSQVNEINISGRGGTDSIVAAFDNDIESAVLNTSRASVSGTSFEFTAKGFRNIQLSTNSDNSLLVVRDSAGNETVEASFEGVHVNGNGFEHVATGFDNVLINSTGGFDKIHLTGSEGADRLIANSDRTVLRSGQGRLVANGFERATAFGNGGADVAHVRDSEGNDQFSLHGRQVEANLAGHRLVGSGFSRIFVEASAGYDTVELLGTSLSDTLVHRSDRTRFSSDYHFNSVIGFDQINAFGRSESDIARVFDSFGNDHFTVDGIQASLSNHQQVVYVRGFETINAISTNGGYDSASLYGTEFRDQLSSTENKTTLTTAASNEFSVRDFDYVSVDTRGGEDTTELTGSAQRDLLRSLNGQLELETTMRTLRVINAELHHFDGRDGDDEVLIDHFGDSDLLAALGDGAIAYLDSKRIELTDIEVLEARTRAGETASYEIDAVDYLYLLDGSWQDSSED